MKFSAGRFMSAIRMRFISGVLIALAAVSLLEIASGKEHWPFCSYQMYSHVNEEKSITRLRLFGLPAKKAASEFPIYDFKYLRPFDSSRLARALLKIQEKPEHDRLFQKALRNVFERYEAMRQKGMHRGPELQRIRLYELHWEIRPGRENSETPARVTRIAEYSPLAGA